MDSRIEYKVVNEHMLNEMISLYVETFNTEPWNDSWTADTALQRINAVLHADGFYGLAMYQNNIMCGFILGWFEQYCETREFAIREFAIRNTGRGQGLGTKLYAELEQKLKNDGVNKITLLTLKGVLTEHFYEKNGFQTSKEIILMSKTI